MTERTTAAQPSLMCDLQVRMLISGGATPSTASVRFRVLRSTSARKMSVHGTPMISRRPEWGK